MIKNTKAPQYSDEYITAICELTTQFTDDDIESICTEITNNVEEYIGPQTQLNNLVENVKEWSKIRGLDKQDPTKQLVKMQEELGELSQGYLKEKPAQVIDSLGDLLVVIIIFCQQENLEVVKVLQAAWDQIKDRHGKIVDGTYVKDSDLND